MKFIFPQNYNLNTKLLGIIDYTGAIVCLVWGIFVFLLANIVFKALSIKLFLCIVLIFPVVIFSILGVDGENILFFLSYVLKFIFKQKLYLYEKSEK